MDGQDGDDPKQSTADMTVFVQNLLQQMQSRFQAMSESIITKNILSSHIQHIFQCFGPHFLNFLALDEMGSRIGELEESINELKTEMGAEGSPSSSTTSGPKPEEAKTENDSA
ncbi:hypothetical protein Nepgr_020624 [Nepenthes gracilis]|uniref:Uncharacterized protein n=1 Tax=Nepenthes gracilis TaxID=150966 RepID=A0AAD3SVL2_NEPGR|nr:hypothetical protein Nepgr_020624 [Nepenthes gracilis]